MVFVCNGCYQQPVEQLFAEISPIEFVAEIILQVLGPDIVVYIHQQTLNVADDKVCPRKDLSDFAGGLIT